LSALSPPPLLGKPQTDCKWCCFVLFRSLSSLFLSWSVPFVTCSRPLFQNHVTGENFPQGRNFFVLCIWLIPGPFFCSFVAGPTLETKELSFKSGPHPPNSQDSLLFSMLFMTRSKPSFSGWVPLKVFFCAGSPSPHL